MGFPWTLLAQGINDTNRTILDGVNLYLSEKQRQKQNYFSEENLALAKEAAAAQREQQALENEWYLNERDYQRTLQQTIFDREDTAMQRARDDFEAAGFSPLAAVGNMAGAGQVVASASSPGSMVSNNQASTQVSNFVGDALTTMANHADSAAGRALTQLMQSKQMSHDEDMAEVAHDNAVKLKTYEIQGALMQSLASASAQRKLQELIGGQNLEAIKQQGQNQLDAIKAQGQNALDLQNDSQEWQDSQAKTRTPDQIAEQFFNWLQKEDPLVAELTDGYKGWEIGFKVTKELLMNLYEGAQSTMDSISEGFNSFGENLNPKNWFK